MMRMRALAAHGSMVRVLTAYALCAVVQFATWIAVILYAFAQEGVQLAGVVAVVQILPAAIFAPVLVGLMERLTRGVALALAHGLVAAFALATTVALLMPAPVAVVVGGSSLTSLAIALVRPLHFAVLPRLARSPEEIVSANAVSSMGDGVALFAGPVLAGVGVQVGGPVLVFGVSTALALAASVLCLRLDTGRVVVPGDSGSAGWRAAFEGLVVVWRDWAAITLLVVLASRFVIGGSVDVMGMSFAESVLDLDASGAGLVIGVVGIGAMAGGALAGVLAVRPRLASVVAAGAVLEGLAFAAVALTHALAPALLVLALCGAGGAVLLVSGRTLLQRTTEDGALARVFAVQEGVSLLGVAAGAALAPLLVRQWGPANAFVPLGVGAALVAIACALIVRRLDDKAVLVPAQMELIRQVTPFAALPPYHLERLARNADWLSVPAGAVVIRQGQPGALFYIVDSGEFTVSVDDQVLPTRLSRGDSFGELALLRSEPRSATVMAATDASLLTVGREEFLAVVTGSVDGRAWADELSRRHAGQASPPDG